MTPYQRQLAEHASTETHSEKLQALVTELPHTLDNEVEDNRVMRTSCERDCPEHTGEAHLLEPLAAALPENVTRVVRWA
jgi:hypothetical protein